MQLCGPLIVADSEFRSMIPAFDERHGQQSRSRSIRTSSRLNEPTWKRDLEAHFPYRLAVGLKPLDSFLQSVAQAMSSLETEELLGTADVKTSARLAVRLGDIPLDLTGKSHLNRNHPGK